jgi:hypothetical protein
MRAALPGRSEGYHLVKGNRFCANKLQENEIIWLACQRENFLYLIRCGMIESVPSRRILSFS